MRGFLGSHYLVNLPVKKLVLSPKSGIGERSKRSLIQPRYTGKPALNADIEQELRLSSSLGHETRP